MCQTYACWCKPWVSFGCCSPADGTINGWSGLSLKSRFFQDVSEIFELKCLVQRMFYYVSFCILSQLQQSMVRCPLDLTCWLRWHQSHMACHVLCSMILILSYHTISYRITYNYALFGWLDMPKCNSGGLRNSAEASHWWIMGFLQSWWVALRSCSWSSLWSFVETGLNKPPWVEDHSYSCK